MNENLIEVFETCGKEIRALKTENQCKDWEIRTLKESNEKLCDQIEALETELKAAIDTITEMQRLKPEKVSNGKL